MFKTKQIKTLLASILIGVTAAFSMSAFAVNGAMLDLLKILRDKGSISAEEYDLLVNAAKADAEQVEGNVNEMKTNVAKASEHPPEINTKGKLEITHGDNTFRIGGRLQGDTTFGLGDVNLDSEGGQPVTEFRRARMYLSGTLQKYWKFKFQYDFAGQRASADTDGIKAAYIAYTGFKPVTVTFGHHKTPLSLEQLTSSKYITFIERSQLVNGIVADTGGGYQYALSANGFFNDMFTLAGSIHAGSANEDSADSQTGFTTRLTYSPIHANTRAAHLGFGFDYSVRSDGGFEIDAEPEIHPGADILENEANDFKKSTTWVLEGSGVWGPLSLQGEYAANKLKKSATSPNLDASAWYVYGSYYLTGESRNYTWKQGAYSQTKVKNPLHRGGIGAWEVALRYTAGDFDNAGGVVSSAADLLTAGLNWYPANNIRFSANYVDVLDSNPGADTELAGDLDTGATAEAAKYLVLRGQWYF